MISPFPSNYARMCISKRVHIIRTCTRKRQNGYISSERVPENAKTGTYYLERRARISEKSDVARENQQDKTVFSPNEEN